MPVQNNVIQYPRQNNACLSIQQGLSFQGAHLKHTWIQKQEEVHGQLYNIARPKIIGEEK